MPLDLDDLVQKCLTLEPDTQAGEATTQDLAQRQRDAEETRDRELFCRHELERRKLGNARLIIIKSITPRSHLIAYVPWTTECQVPLTFTFMKLPRELRDKIWGYAILEGRIIKLGGKKVLSSKVDSFNPYQSNPEKRWERFGKPSHGDETVPEDLAATGAYWSDKGEFAELTPEELRALETTKHWDQAFRTLQDKANNTKYKAANTKKVNPRKIPSLLQVNKESRAVALQHFTLILGPQRGGKPIWFNFKVDALYVQDDWDLLTICGINNPERFSDRSAHKLVDQFPAERNIIEDNLCFLILDDSLEWTTLQGLARFRSLVTLALKPKKQYSSLNLFTRDFLGFDCRETELELRKQWHKENSKRGNDEKEISIPEFCYANVTGKHLIAGGKNAANYTLPSQERTHRLN